MWEPDSRDKNRIHFDLTPEDTMATEVERLLALGARRAEAFRDITGWTVLEDPEGNEFCVERGPGDRREQ